MPVFTPVYIKCDMGSAMVATMCGGLSFPGTTNAGLCTFCCFGDVVSILIGFFVKDGDDTAAAATDLLVVVVTMVVVGCAAVAMCSKKAD